MTIFILDGQEMITREDAYKHISKILHLPSYFGKNLDGLADMLSYYGSETIIILNHSQLLIDNLEDYGRAMISTFEESSEENSFTFVKK